MQNQTIPSGCRMCQGSQECSGRCSSDQGNSHHTHRNSMTMGGVRGGSTLNEVGVARHVPHYASTPHLFVYQAAEEDEVDNVAKDSKEPIYSSAIDIRKVAASKEVSSCIFGG